MKINKLKGCAAFLITLFLGSSYAQTALGTSLNTQLVVDSGSCDYSRKINKNDKISGHIVWDVTAADDGKYEIKLTDNNKTSPLRKMLRLKNKFLADKDGTGKFTDAKENATYSVTYNKSEHNVAIVAAVSNPTTDFSQIEIRITLLLVMVVWIVWHMFLAIKRQICSTQTQHKVTCLAELKT